MNNIWLISWFTLREAFARKVFIFFAAISAFVILITALVFASVDTSSILGSVQVPNVELKSELIAALEVMIISPVASLGLLLAIFSSASFVPVMLEKGNIDLLLSKPVSRSQLILGKYFGGILVVFLNILFLIIGIWFIISLKFGYWDFSFLLVTLSITFTFAVLYSLMVLFGVLTKSSIPGMMIAYLIFLIISPLLTFLRGQFGNLIDGEFTKGLINFFYYIFPKTSELMGDITLKLALGEALESYQPIWTSILFLLLMIGLAIHYFGKKDL